MFNKPSIEGSQNYFLSSYINSIMDSTNNFRYDEKSTLNDNGTTNDISNKTKVELKNINIILFASENNGGRIVSYKYEIIPFKKTIGNHEYEFDLTEKEIVFISLITSATQNKKDNNILIT